MRVSYRPALSEGAALLIRLRPNGNFKNSHLLIICYQLQVVLDIISLNFILLEPPEVVAVNSHFLHLKKGGSEI